MKNYGEPGWFESWKKAIKEDNEQYMSGRISHDEYWRRVDRRDAQIKTMSPQDRRRINHG